jgi:cell division protein FtsA
MMKEQAIIAGLDLGTTNTTAVIAELGDDTQPFITGLGAAPSKGLRKGAVVNPDAAIDPIRRAIEEAERMAGVEIGSVCVSMSGSLLRGLNNRGVIAITNPDRRITQNDVRRVNESASVITLAGGQEIIDVLPQEYIVDGQDGITDPANMLGTRLGVAVHIITGPITVRQNITTAVNNAGLSVTEVVLEPMAAAEAVLTDDEREYGSVVINLGGETTSLALYQQGAVQHTAIFPLGGSHFTNDLAYGLRTPIPDAERIKREYGCVLASMVAGANHIIDVPSGGDRPPRSLSWEILCEILHSRAEEVLNHINDEIRRAGFERQLSSGVILTGGSAQLRGMVELAERIFDCPARVGYPLGVSGLTEQINSPLYATAIGLVLMAARASGTYSFERQNEAGHKLSKTAARVKGWLSQLF